MVKLLTNLFNKREREEIAKLKITIFQLEYKINLLKSDLHMSETEATLLKRELEDKNITIRNYENQIKKLTLSLGDLSKTSNNYREY